jgi:serine/threonine protein kinase
MIGETLGSYVVKAQIGVGGMGAVYLAEHPLIGRKVAVKMLRPEYSSNEEAIQRFFREARSTASLRHPALIDVMDFGVYRPTGSAYIIMEFLEGESLESRLKKGRPTLHTAIDFARQIAVGVSVAHAAGIVHRDLKPGNIFIQPDLSRRGNELIKILDFGIAKLTKGDAGGKATRTDIVLGTPLYMSPEQCRGAGAVDHRADIYSLGCILFEMLCGRLPFVYPWAGELIAAHLHEAPPPPRSLEPSIPPAIEAITLRALSKKPDDRQQSMDQLVAELDAFITSDSSWPSAGIGSGPPLPAPGPSARPQAILAPTLPSDPPPGATNEDRPPSSTVIVTADDLANFGSQVAIQQVEEKPVNASTLSRGAATREVPPQTSVPAKQGKVAPIAIGIGSVGILAIGATLFFRHPHDDKTAQGSGPTTTATATATATNTTPPEPPRENTIPTANPEPPPPRDSPPAGTTTATPDTTASAVPPTQPTAQQSDTIRVSITNGRKGLTVRVDGHPAGLPVRLPRDGQFHELSFETPNFKPESRRIKADKDQALVLDNKPGFYVP